MENIPEDRPGAAGRQPLRRQHHPRHDRLHPRLQHLLRRRAALLPARPQPGPRLPGRAVPAASSGPSPPPTRTRARRSTPARRCSSTRAATGRCNRPTWESNRIDFAGRKGFIRLALDAGVPIVPVVSVGGQETALFLSHGERLARLLRLDKLSSAEGPADLLALPWGINVGDFLGHLPLPAKITVQVLEPIDLRERFGRDPDLDRGLRGRHRRRCRTRSSALAAERRLPVIG